MSLVYRIAPLPAGRVAGFRGPETRILPRKLPKLGCRLPARFYSQANRTQPRNSPSVRKASPPRNARPAAKTPAEVHRHEVQERTEAVNVPFNPPGGGGGPGIGGSGSLFPITRSPLLDAALTTVVGLGMVFLGGVAYLKWYKKNVLDKIETAFAAGYDPALELATQAAQPRTPRAGDEDLNYDLDDAQSHHLRRKEQDAVDQIIHGKEHGHYFVLLGPKGSGKTTMIFDAMQAIEAENVAMCDAHPDLEVFRLRLGKALNYEYNEDSQTGLFQRRDPREGGPALDIERAMNKLEKVALRCARRTGRPLILIINNIHFFKNDDDGRNMLLQLQQRGEAWGASGILTLVFTTDDFWPLYVLRQCANRMRVLSISDLNAKEALHAIPRLRMNARRKMTDQADMNEAVSILGGRLSYLSKASNSKDMLQTVRSMMSVEKAWLLSQIGLIQDCDDDVMDEQKWSSCSWLLLREFVKMRREQERMRDDTIKSGQIRADDIDAVDLPLPSIPFWRVRQLMTRTDFIEQLDRLNIIAIDPNHNVRPDSMLILHAAREVVEEDSFDEILDSVRDRIDEIESLHRTRELTFKDVDKGDRIRLSVDKGGSRIVDA